MNDNDWLRKRFRNPRAGCFPLLLVLILAAAVVQQVG